MRLLKTRIRVCAVGMTKELDSPDGAIRVYVNDKTWQENVRELMEKAQEIYILINDRDSCLWEIEQSASMQSKTTYIVSDLDKYNRARSALKDSLEFPPIVRDEKYEDAFFSLTHDGSAFKVDSFPNDLEGHNLVAHGNIQQVYHRDRLRKEIATGWAVIFGPATLFVLVSALYYLCNLIFHFESDTHMAIIAFSIPVVFLALVLYQYFSYLKAHRVKESE
jgi:CYTH domain-containing protein